MRERLNKDGDIPSIWEEVGGREGEVVIGEEIANSSDEWMNGWMDE